MQYKIRIDGISSLIQHSIAGLDATTEVNREKSKILGGKPASKRTVAEDKRIIELECIQSIWWGEDGAPTVPTRVIRANLEAAARKLKDGTRVREGLIVTSSRFEYDRARYGNTQDEVAFNAIFTAPVRVQRSSVMRTRAKFDTPWSVEYEIDADDELVDEAALRSWIDIGGRRIGIGDWRPTCSGEYGRFKLASIEAIDD